MANNYPETVPDAYKTHEDLESAYRKGWNHGHGIASHNVPTIGDRISPEVDYQGLGARVDAENIRDYHSLLCHAGADNSRQFSPFECTASEFNSHPAEPEEDDDTPTSEECWEAFEAGTADAISADLAEYDDEAYGIEPEEEEEEPEDLTGLDPIALVNRLLDAYAAIDDIADMYMGSGDGTAEDRATQRRSNLVYIAVQNAILTHPKTKA
jgi:hypothetical protein